MKYSRWLIFLLSVCSTAAINPAGSAAAQSTEAVSCEILVVGGGLSGVATAYEALRNGHTVCLTEITDWLGGQLSAQGTSALDERPTQRQLQFFPQGYLEFRQRIAQRYETLNPGRCWVSQVCFPPRGGHEIALAMLQDAAKRGGGTLQWFPNTVVKELQTSPGNIQAVRAIQHAPAPGTPPLNTYPLSRILEDAYRERDSALLRKKLIRFVPPASGKWYVVEATETGELLALADLPYRLGIDPRSYRDPSASSATQEPYCPQGYTYTFAMQATATPQFQRKPEFYNQYASYYSYELPRLANFSLVFTYRRIWSANPQAGDRTVTPGDISMQNWTWGNDYRPGTPLDNLIYSREQLAATGQLTPGGWQGGLRTESLRKAEELAQGYFYWLATGTTDSKLGPGVKEPYFRLRYLQGLRSPMGTVHGLSKYPYIRESRRLIGRVDGAYPQGFAIAETDISRKDYRQPYYQETLPPSMYEDLLDSLTGIGALGQIQDPFKVVDTGLRSRARIYPDSVGIGHYAIDFHPCMALNPPERSGNYERPGERQAEARTYPFQIPLRAMIPPRINNLIVTGKNIATSHISAAAYRVHSFEWSAGAAAGTTAAFALDTGVSPYQLVENLPRRNPSLEALQNRLRTQGNPTTFPDTSMFNQSWQEWQ